MSQDMQTCITPVDMLRKDSMHHHGREDFGRYAGAVACVDSYGGAMSGLGESRSDFAARQLRVRLNRFELAVLQRMQNVQIAAAASAAATDSEVERLFGRVDKSTRRKRQRTS